MRKIIIADDNSINRKILNAVLCNEYEIIEAENGREAMKILKLQSDEISAMLLDLLMPEMDGYEVLRAVRADQKLCSIPVIVTTQQDDTESGPVTLALGASDYLSKPYNPEIIKHRLHNLIGLREAAAFIAKVEKDSVTGLYTEDAFISRVAKLIESDEHQFFYLVAMEIEHFNLIGDMFGIEEGNQLMIFLSRLIQKALRRTGGIAGRTDKARLIMLCPVDEEGDEKELVRVLDEGLAHYPLDFNLSSFYGVYKVDKGLYTVSEMCEMTQTALDHAKEQRDNTVVYYDEEFHQRVMEEKQITYEMKSALESGQFHAYYQPKYNLTTGKIIEAEALVRWIHPERGVMPPRSYLPIFERNGFIAKMDAEICDLVCADLKGWRERGIKIMPISVNISWVDLYNPNLPELLTGIVKKHGLSTDYLHLELTETVYTQNPKVMLDAIKKLRDSGFVIAIDNFGLGYSSLNMLSKVPVDELKLDMRSLENNLFVKGNKSIIKFIVELAKDMGLKVIAEGVETEDDYQYLKSIGCKEGQGYYFSKPLPAYEFVDLIK